MANWCNWNNTNNCGGLSPNPITADYPFNLSTCQSSAGHYTPAGVYDAYPNGFPWSAAACTPSAVSPFYTATASGAAYVFTYIFTPTCNVGPPVVSSGCTSTTAAPPLLGFAPYSPNSGAGGGAVLLPLMGVLVTVTIDGYDCDLALSINPTGTCADGGFSVALSDALIINSLQTGSNGVGGSNTYQSVYAALRSAGFTTAQLAWFLVTDESPGTDTAALVGQPAIAAVVQTYIHVETDALSAAPVSTSFNPSAADSIEAILNSAINSGTLNAALPAGQGALPASNVQSVRATRDLDNAQGCPIVSADMVFVLGDDIEATNPSALDQTSSVGSAPSPSTLIPNSVRLHVDSFRRTLFASVSRLYTRPTGLYLAEHQQSDLGYPAGQPDRVSPKQQLPGGHVLGRADVQQQHIPDQQLPGLLPVSAGQRGRSGGARDVVRAAGARARALTPAPTRCEPPPQRARTHRIGPCRGPARQLRRLGAALFR